MDTTTIRVREPRELLALLPYQLGFRPRDSAVAVALRPPRGRVGLIARVDLADLAEPELGPALCRRLVTHLVGDGASRAVLVLYVAEDPRPWPVGAAPEGAVVGMYDPRDGDASGAREEPGEPFEPARPARPADPGEPDDLAEPAARRAVRHFRRAAAGFLGDVAVWVVGESGYLALDCLDAACCPPGGRPLAELQSTEVGAHMVLAGAMVADSREGLVPDRPAPARARRNACRAAARAAARRSAAAAGGGRALAAWRTDALATWRAGLAASLPGGPPPTDADLGRLLTALDDVRVRDAVLLTLVAGPGHLPERSLEDRPAHDEPLGRAVADALAAIVSPRDGVPPDAGTLIGATALLEHVVGHARGTQRAPALTLLGLLAWWHGDGARAAVLLERALRADPDHRLAQLLAEALTAGLAPGWVRRPR